MKNRLILNDFEQLYDLVHAEAGLIYDLSLYS